MNQLFQGDNLEILHNMPGGSVDLICTDPPFNTGKDWGAFDDRWEGGLDEYLKFMEARVVEMRRVLKDTGSLYLHCDPTASHYLKVMLDGVFGIGNFRNEIVWCYTGPGSPKMRQFNRKHDILFWYSKGKQWAFNKDDIRLPYALSTVARGKYDSNSPTTGAGFRDTKRGKVPESWWGDFPIGKRTNVKKRTP